MWGAIIGDIIGSRFEHHNIKTKRFELFHKDCQFTDDTTLSVATMDAILHNSEDFTKYYRKWAKKYPHAGYGKSFKQWTKLKDPMPYNSWGNGSAMRVSPCSLTFPFSHTQRLAIRSAECTHNHPEGIKGAVATNHVLWLCRFSASKRTIREQVEQRYYTLPESIKSIKKDYKFDVSCQGTVPVAIQAFLDSKNFVDTIRIAVSVGGDSDTICAISGGFAEMYYKKIPKKIIEKARTYLTPEMLKVIDKFSEKYKVLS